MASDIHILLADFRNRFSEFSDVSDETVTMCLEDAIAIYSLTDRGVVYLAAHLYVVDKDGADGVVDGGAGVITSDRTGKRQNTYKSQSERNADSFYETTKYGRKYLQFRRGGFRARVYG